MSDYNLDLIIEEIRKNARIKVLGEAVYGGKKEEPTPPQDSRMTVTAADRKANTLAWQKYKKGNPAYKAADHVQEEWKTVSKKAIDKLGGVANSGDMLNQARYTHKKGEKPPSNTTLRKRLEAQAKEAGLPPHRGQKGGMKREYSAATADAMLGNDSGPAAAAIKAGDQKDTPHVQYYLNYMKGKKK